MIRIDNLSAGYNNIEILHNISATFEKGSITVIIGPNGSGKSTLLKSILRTTKYFSGSIFIDDENICNMSRRAIASKIAYLSQNKQVPEITAERMILNGRFVHKNYPKIYKEDDIRIVNGIMQKLEIDDIADKMMKELSGGVQQKVYIASVLAQQTDVVLMDEPTSFLDVSYQIKMNKFARMLAEEKKTVIMVTHDIASAMECADKIVLLNNGLIVTSSTSAEIYENRYIDKVFGVKLNKIKTEKGDKFFCEDG